MDTSTPGRAAADAGTPSAAAPAATDTGGLYGLRRYTYWSMVVATVVLLLLPTVTGPVPLPPDPLGTASLAGGLVVVVAVMRLTGRLVPRTPDTPPLPAARWRAWAVAGGVAALVVAAASVTAGDEILWAFAPAMVASLLVADLPRRPRRAAVPVAIGVVAAAGIALGLARGEDPLTAFPLGGAIVTAFVMFLTLATVWTWEVAVALDAARRTAATLAVANERLRFAADLHDIQGHHLQVIALKSELASRLLRADPDGAEREMTAVRQLAADALHDTRAVVQGYRRATLDAEIANASNVLASAGIDARLHLDQDARTGTLPEPGRHLLGLVLREAVTNILRHSAATRTDVTLTRDGLVGLTVTNDGAGSDAPARHPGGLGDLAKRFHAAGGALSWRRAGDRFELRAQLPTAPGAEPTQGQAPGRPGGERP